MVFKDAAPEPPGAKVVGRFADMAEGDQRLVTAIRHWMDGPDYAQAVRQTLAPGRDAIDARGIVVPFEAFMAAVAVSINRRLHRHAPACPCISEDEIVLVSLVRDSTSGGSASVRRLAADIMHPHRVEAVADAAEWLGAAMTLPQMQARSSGTKIRCRGVDSNHIH